MTGPQTTVLATAVDPATAAPATTDTEAPTLLAATDAAAVATSRPAHALAAGDSPLPDAGAGAPGATLPGTHGDSGDGACLQQAGRYLIRERLGRGGMASVFRAHDPGIGRDVAIKFLHATLCQDAEYRSRFLREARAAGGLSHPHIVTVYDVGEIEGRPYMAMELLAGVPLSQAMEHGRMLPVRDVVVLGVQLARALDYAHAHGIVHRDIKPGNIVCLHGGQEIKVTDFGIAHMDMPGSGEQATRVGDVLGTPQYMSPEQARGEKLDGRSDLFSVGIVLYQMLAGQRPFEGDSLVALAVKIATTEAPPLQQLRPDAPAALRRIVERCLAKPPERRFQTGAELAAALTRVLAEIDEAARAAARPRIVPLRVKWALTMALIVAVVMATTATVIQQRQGAALGEQVIDYGASLARFIAAQNAVGALAEDWAGVDVALQVVLRTGDFHGIVVIDRDGIVRAAGDASLVGQPYRAPAAEVLGTRPGEVVLSRYHAAGEPVLGFAVPITFTGKTVGRVALGLTERPLLRLARLSTALMAALVVVTVLAVAVAMYIVAEGFARPIRRVVEGMDDIGRGQFEHRIGATRRDEFGQLYAAFDRMAQALDDARARTSAPAPSASPAGEAAPGGPAA